MGATPLPFARQFCGRPLSYIWEDDGGATHEIRQGEGGEQGDPLMPALFALGQQRALVAAQSAMHPSTKLMAFLNDVYVVTPPPPSSCGRLICSSRQSVVGVRGDQNQSGQDADLQQGRRLPSRLPAHFASWETVDSPVVVWRGDSALPSDQQGVTILGTPLGHVDFVRAQLCARIEEHRFAGSCRSCARSPVRMVDSLILRSHPTNSVCLHPPASAAVPLTPLAIIVQPARGLESLGDTTPTTTTLRCNFGSSQQCSRRRCFRAFACFVWSVAEGRCLLVGCRS